MQRRPLTATTGTRNNKTHESKRTGWENRSDDPPECGSRRQKKIHFSLALFRELWWNHIEPVIPIPLSPKTEI